jgi:trehalose 6-phosphate synthase/phosphatase
MAQDNSQATAQPLPTSPRTATLETSGPTAHLTPQDPVSSKAPMLEGDAFTAEPASVDGPAAATAQSAKSPAEMLKRLSLDGKSLHESFDSNPREEYPDLELSGTVISVNFCLPWTVGLAANGKWGLQPRQGTSALFDSFHYLSSSKNPWKHNLVGWTGEIQALSRPPSESQSSGSANQAGPTPKKPGGPLRSLTELRLRAAANPTPDPANTGVVNPHADTVTVTEADRHRLESRLRERREGVVTPVWLSDEADDSDTELQLKDQSRWRRYGEHELFTLFHYKQHAPDHRREESKWWADYVRMNQLFADRILEIYRPGDVVWIHDYHLMLLPHLLRQRIPNIYIGFFLHIPFPSSEYVRCLPRRKDLLEGCLGSTMVGFQSYSYARHFSSCCERVLGFESSSAGVDAYGAHVAMDVFPIGINVDEVRETVFGGDTTAKIMAAVQQLYGNRKIIVGRDRLDTVRGVAQKLMAFEMFLARYPEWRDKVVLIQVTSPSSVVEQQEDADHKIEHQISDLVSRINGAYGSLSHSPVQHYPQYLSRGEYFALLRVADVGLITSVRDGMNTTSLEYVLCQTEHYGPLILSEFSGTAGSLRDAIHINPWDLGGVAKAIKKALEMPAKEREVAHRKLYDHVVAHPVSRWCDSFLRRLLTNVASHNQNAQTPALDRHLMKPQYLRAKRLRRHAYSHRQGSCGGNSIGQGGTDDEITGTESQELGVDYQWARPTVPGRVDGSHH